jgi:hypothetical protein
MRKYPLALFASVIGLTVVVTTDALAAVSPQDHRFTVVPGSQIKINFATLVNDDAGTDRSMLASFQDFFLARPKSDRIRLARVNCDGTITVRFTAGFTGSDSFRYGIGDVARNASERPRTFSRASAIFRVVSPN